MREHPLFQSSLRRAVDDTIHAPRQNPWFFWSIGIVMVALGGFLGTVYTPEGSGRFLSAICPTAGVIIGAIIGIIIIFIINLIMAPYRQRNELREKIIKLESDIEDKKQRAQLREDVSLLIIEGTEVLKGFKSVHTFGDTMPTEEFKIWREKGSEIFLRHKLNTEYSLWFRDVYIDISDSLLADYVKACEAGLDRLEHILNTIVD